VARLGRAIPRRLQRAPVVTTGAGSISGTAAADLAGLTATAAGTRTVVGSAAAALGALTSSVVALPGAPGDILDIGATAPNHFSLQYAVTGAGSPSTATQADIAAGFYISPYFYPTSDGQRVQMWARLDAPPTSGASFSRSELREVNADGTDVAWDANVGRHEMRVKITPTHLAAVTPAAVFAQMYDTVATADRISFRTQLVSGTARLRIRINGSTVAMDATSPINPGSNDLATGVNNIVGAEWDLKIVLSGGAIAIYVNNMTTPVLTRPAGTLAANGAANYFKTGLYNQASTATGDSGSDWGSSELRALSVTHATLGVAAAPLGAVVAAAAGTVGRSGTAAAPLGALTATATGVVRRSGSAAAPLGGLVAATTGGVTHVAGASALLGGLSSAATGVRRVVGTAAATLGGVSGVATGRRATSGTATAVLGGLSAAAAGVRASTRTAAAALGGITAAAVGVRKVTATATAALGALTAAVSGIRSTAAGAAAALGGLTSAGVGRPTATGGAAAPLGGLSGSAAGTRSLAGAAAAALGGLTSAGSTAQPQPAPIAAYSFDESGSTVVDTTANGHSFALGSDLVRTTDGHTAGGLTTLAANAITPLGTGPFGQTPDRTVMMWARGTGSVWYIRWQVASIDSGAWGILCLGGDVGVQLRDSSGFQRFMTTGPSDGLWHHYAATYNNTTSTAVFYLDGVSAASGTFTGPVRADADSLDLAEFGPGTVIDDLRIYDTALTATQVAAAAAAPVGALGSGTAAAPLGGLASTATGRRSTTGAAAAALGGLSATATGTRTALAAAAAPLGGVGSAATATTTRIAAASAGLGGLTSTATGVATVTGAAAAPLGPVVAAAAGGSSTPGAGEAFAPLGGLSAAAVGRRTTTGAAAADLAALHATTSGVRSTAASSSALLGALAGTATGQVTTVVTGTASADLGTLIAAALQGAEPTPSLGPLHAGTITNIPGLSTGTVLNPDGITSGEVTAGTQAHAGTVRTLVGAGAGTVHERSGLHAGI
jgi:hypothetical protein